MEKYIIILPDGTELTSGNTTPALKNVTLTRSVNADEELTLGSVCAAMLEAEVITDDGGWGITQGQELTLYTQDASGNRTQEGVFIAQKPERLREHTYRLTAYDRVVLLDRDLTAWLAALTEWPYDLRAFAQMVCSQCGVQLRGGDLPNGSYQLRPFSADGVTGRQLMKWVAELSGCFCRATRDGQLELGWYTPQAVQIKPVSGSVTVFSREQNLSLFANALTAREAAPGEMEISSQMLEVTDDTGGNVALCAQTDDRLFYYQGGLKTADYQVQPVEKVHLKLTAEDVGTVYPDVPEAVNTYTVSGNYLLCEGSAQEHKSVAQTLYEQLSGVRYTPCTLTLPVGTGIEPGQIVSVTDTHGNTHTMYVMTQKRTGHKDVFSCTGSARRDSTGAVNTAVFQDLRGKLLTLQMDMDGLHLENKQSEEKTARLSLTVDGISTQVQQNEAQTAATEQRISTLEQSARDISVQIQSIRDTGVSQVTTTTGYTFSGDGLHIGKSGEEMENCLDHTGMYVKRGDEVLLQANDRGVTATDVTVHSFLVAGGHARFESYSQTGADERTACFYV